MHEFRFQASRAPYVYDGPAAAMIKKLIGRDDCSIHMMVGGTPCNVTVIAAALLLLLTVKKLDNSDGDPYLSDAEYETLDNIRDIRNYWCHQCYLDYVYIQNKREQEERFQRLARRLENEYNRVYKLHRKLQDFYFDNFVED